MYIWFNPECPLLFRESYVPVRAEVTYRTMLEQFDDLRDYTHSMTNCVRPQEIPVTWIITLNASLEPSTKLAEEFSELKITVQIWWPEHGFIYNFNNYISTGVHSVDSHFERNDTLVATLPLVTFVKFSPVATTTITTTTTTQYFRTPLLRCFKPSC